MDFSNLYAKNKNSADGLSEEELNSNISSNSPVRNNNEKIEEDLDKAFGKKIVAENLHLAENPPVPKTAIDHAIDRTNKKNFIIKAIGIVLFLFVIAFGVIAATDNLYRITGTLPNNPKKAIGLVVDNMKKVKSMHTEGSMTFDLEIKSDVSKSVNKEKIKYDIKGDSVWPDKNHFTFKVVSSMPTLLKTSFETITVGGKGYMKPVNIPEFKLNEDAWYEINSEIIDKTEGFPVDMSIVGNSYINYIKEIKLADSNNVNSHYNVIIDADKIFASGGELGKLKEIYGGDIEKIDITEDIWVGNGSKIINKQATNMSFVVKVNASEEDISAGIINIKADIILEFSDFGKPLAIEVPENVKDISELTGQTVNENDAKRTADLALIGNSLKAYHKDNNGYPSTDLIMQRLNNDENVLLKELTPKYIASLLLDPNDPKAFYGYKSDGKDYELTAVLENGNDPFCKIEGSLCIFRIKNGDIVSKK